MSAELKFRPELSTPGEFQITLVFDHPSQEFLESREADAAIMKVAAQYGYGGAYSKQPSIYLVDAATDRAVVQFDPKKPTAGFRGEYTFVRPR